MRGIVGLVLWLSERLVYRKGNGFAFMPQVCCIFKAEPTMAESSFPPEALRPDQLHEPKPQCQPTAEDTQPYLYGRIVQINGGDMIIVTDCTVC